MSKTAQVIFRMNPKPLFRQIERGELRAYTSALTFDELAYRLLLALIKDH